MTSMQGTARPSTLAARMKTSVATFFACLCAVSAGAQESPAYGVVQPQSWQTYESVGKRGIHASCVDLQRFAFFRFKPEDEALGVIAAEWDSDERAFVRNKDNECVQYQLRNLSQAGGYSTANDPRKLAIEDMSLRVARVADEIIAQNKLIREASARSRREAEKNAADSAKALAASKAYQLSACVATLPGALYATQEKILTDKKQIAYWSAAQEHERRVAEAAGVRDLRRERENGFWLVQARDDLAKHAAEYKTLSAQAGTTGELAGKRLDPCGSFR